VKGAPAAAPPWLQPALNQFKEELKAELKAELQPTIQAVKKLQASMNNLQTSIDKLQTELEEQGNRFDARLISIERTCVIVRTRSSCFILSILMAPFKFDPAPAPAPLFLSWN